MALGQVPGLVCGKVGPGAPFPVSVFWRIVIDPLVTRTALQLDQSQAVLSRLYSQRLGGQGNR
jgi:hypothetical protein